MGAPAAQEQQHLLVAPEGRDQLQGVLCLCWVGCTPQGLPILLCVAQHSLYIPLVSRSQVPCAGATPCRASILSAADEVGQGGQARWVAVLGQDLVRIRICTLHHTHERPQHLAREPLPQPLRPHLHPVTACAQHRPQEIVHLFVGGGCEQVGCHLVACGLGTGQPRWTVPRDFDTHRHSSSQRHVWLLFHILRGRCEGCTVGAGGPKDARQSAS
mmetsp:Transcript_5972/g.15880  ORF Transcript_5972/g.15880 Transcript_5972/m.15880 type:complete len:215 (+) Transcript_5972:1332-1976(+)